MTAWPTSAATETRSTPPTVSDEQSERLDVAMVRRGLARSRGQARQLVGSGTVVVDGRPATKASQPVTASASLDLQSPPERWVGRGAYKLLRALDVFGPQGLSVDGLRCLDVGASTGGFTQVLLERGAREVVALDVGHGQLAAPVARDVRVVDRPGTNIRDVGPNDLGGRFDVIVGDLSFISLRLVLGPMRRLLADGGDRPDGGDMVVLVKPQFEVGRDRLGRRGVVTSRAEQERAVLGVVDRALDLGLEVRGVIPSPIRGGDGNREYLLWVSPPHPTSEGVMTPHLPAPDLVRAAVRSPDPVPSIGGARP